MTRWLLIIIAGICSGVITGVIFTHYNIRLHLSYMWIGVIIVGLIVFIVSSILQFRPWKKMFGLLNRGEYAKVIDLMQEVISKHQGKKSYENAAFYNIALCYFQMGYFEKSLQYLDRMDPNRLNKKMKTAYFMAYAGNLISLKRDLEAARQYLKEAYKIVPYSMIYLSMAIVEKLLGNNEDSKTLLEKYLSTKDNMKSKYGLVMLYVDQYSKMIAENFMLGWLYYLNGEHNKAIPYLEVARQCKYENYAAKKARELLRLLEPSSALAD